MPKRKCRIYKAIKKKLEDKHGQIVSELDQKQPKEVEWLKARGVSPRELRQRSRRLLATGVVTSSLLLTPGIVTGPTQALPAPFVEEKSLFSIAKIRKKFKEALKKVLPKKIKPLSSDQEAKISEIIWDHLGIKATPELDENRLNVTYGVIGGEQHLKRFPGDVLSQHDEFRQAGIAPGLGAWGYFALSKKALTPDLTQKEKYYVAVQTLYLKDWATRQPEIKDWYKYQKTVVVNPETGQAVVAVVADAGPAWWTGKVFGGSPEVMHHLGLDRGKRKGPVILFFVDDPEHKVPLGPVL